MTVLPRRCNVRGATMQNDPKGLPRSGDNGVTPTTRTSARTVILAPPASAGIVAAVVAATGPSASALPVSAAAPTAGTVLAKDTFHRTVGTGLGSAETGGAYTLGYS